MVVPVALRHIQIDGLGLHYGLEFRPMSLRQAARLAVVVAGLIAGNGRVAGILGRPEPSDRVAAPA